MAESAGCVYKFGVLIWCKKVDVDWLILVAFCHVFLFSLHFVNSFLSNIHIYLFYFYVFFLIIIICLLPKKNHLSFFLGGELYSFFFLKRGNYIVLSFFFETYIVYIVLSCVVLICIWGNIKPIKVFNINWWLVRISI